MIFGYDVVHGYKTMLPIPLGQAASWDADVAREGNKLAAKEAASSGLTWAFAPMIDVSPDGRWGRIMESPGEDPYLASVMARAWVEGFQGGNLADPLTVAACAKHFAGYGYSMAGRDYNTTDISKQTLYNVVLPPFKSAVDAGVVSLMNGFNDLNGTPVTASKMLQREILKGQWDFEGFVVSDFNSVTELIAHGYAPDRKAAAKAAFQAGSDVEMDSRNYERYLKELLESGEVEMADLDDAVRRVLKTKFDLGLFDDPYKYCSNDRETENLLTDENLEIARDAARKSMVLLKNENDILPLSENTSVAVIGQLALSKDIPLGSWRAQAVSESAVSLVEGIEAVSEANVKSTQGYRLTTGRRNFIYELEFAEPNREDFAEAKKIASEADVVILALGEDCFQTGEGRSQTDIGLKGNQLELFEELVAVNDNIVVVLMNGRPLAIPEVMSKSKAVLESWFAGSQAGHAIADILYGKYNPSGKLPVSFPFTTGQEPLFYNHKNTGRPVTNDFDAGLVFWSHYTDAPNEALVPFGFGLSYSTFDYSDLAVVPGKGKVDVKVKITNISEIAGTETVQVYIRDMFATETQPVQRLVDFRKVQLEGGASDVVEFELTEEDLGFYHNDGSFYAEDGQFVVMIGGNSAEVLSKEVKVTF
jgi:beta-glucosidase